MSWDSFDEPDALPSVDDEDVFGQEYGRSHSSLPGGPPPVLEDDDEDDLGVDLFGSSTPGGMFSSGPAPRRIRAIDSTSSPTVGESHGASSASGGADGLAQVLANMRTSIPTTPPDSTRTHRPDTESSVSPSSGVSSNAAPAAMSRNPRPTNPSSSTTSTTTPVAPTYLATDSDDDLDLDLPSVEPTSGTPASDTGFDWQDVSLDWDQEFLSEAEKRARRSTPPSRSTPRPAVVQSPSTPETPSTRPSGHSTSHGVSGAGSRGDQVRNDGQTAEGSETAQPQSFLPPSTPRPDTHPPNLPSLSTQESDAPPGTPYVGGGGHHPTSPTLHWMGDKGSRRTTLPVPRDSETGTGSVQETADVRSHMFGTSARRSVENEQPQSHTAAASQTHDDITDLPPLHDESPSAHAIHSTPTTEEGSHAPPPGSSPRIHDDDGDHATGAKRRRRRTVRSVAGLSDCLMDRYVRTRDAPRPLTRLTNHFAQWQRALFSQRNLRRFSQQTRMSVAVRLAWRYNVPVFGVEWSTMAATPPEDAPASIVEDAVEQWEARQQPFQFMSPEWRSYLWRTRVVEACRRKLFLEAPPTARRATSPRRCLQHGHHCVRTKRRLSRTASCELDELSPLPVLGGSMSLLRSFITHNFASFMEAAVFTVLHRIFVLSRVPLQHPPGASEEDRRWQPPSPFDSPTCTCQVCEAASHPPAYLQPPGSGVEEEAVAMMASSGGAHSQTQQDEEDDDPYSDSDSSDSSDSDGDVGRTSSDVTGRALSGDQQQHKDDVSTPPGLTSQTTGSPAGNAKPVTAPVRPKQYTLGHYLLSQRFQFQNGSCDVNTIINRSLLHLSARDVTHPAKSDDDRYNPYVAAVDAAMVHLCHYGPKGMLQRPKKKAEACCVDGVTADYLAAKEASFAAERKVLLSSSALPASAVTLSPAQEKPENNDPEEDEAWADFSEGESMSGVVEAKEKLPSPVSIAIERDCEQELSRLKAGAQVVGSPLADSVAEDDAVVETSEAVSKLLESLQDTFEGEYWVGGIRVGVRVECHQVLIAGNLESGSLSLVMFDPSVFMENPGEHEDDGTPEHDPRLYATSLCGPVQRTELDEDDYESLVTYCPPRTLLCVELRVIDDVYGNKRMTYTPRHWLLNWVRSWQAQLGSVCCASHAHGCSALPIAGDASGCDPLCVPTAVRVCLPRADRPSSELPSMVRQFLSARGSTDVGSRLFEVAWALLWTPPKVVLRFIERSREDPGDRKEHDHGNCEDDGEWDPQAVRALCIASHALVLVHLGLLRQACGRVGVVSVHEAAPWEAAHHINTSCAMLTLNQLRPSTQAKHLSERCWGIKYPDNLQAGAVSGLVAQNESPSTSVRDLVGRLGRAWEQAIISQRAMPDHTAVTAHSTSMDGLPGWSVSLMAHPTLCRLRSAWWTATMQLHARATTPHTRTPLAATPAADTRPAGPDSGVQSRAVRSPSTSSTFFSPSEEHPLIGGSESDTGENPFLAPWDETEPVVVPHAVLASDAGRGEPVLRLNQNAVPAGAVEGSVGEVAADGKVSRTGAGGAVRNSPARDCGGVVAGNGGSQTPPAPAVSPLDARSPPPAAHTPPNTRTPIPSRQSTQLPQQLPPQPAAISTTTTTTAATTTTAGTATESEPLAVWHTASDDASTLLAHMECTLDRLKALNTQASRSNLASAQDEGVLKEIHDMQRMTSHLKERIARSEALANTRPGSALGGAEGVPDSSGLLPPPSSSPVPANANPRLARVVEGGYGFDSPPDSPSLRSQGRGEGDISVFGSQGVGDARRNSSRGSTKRKRRRAKTTRSPNKSGTRSSAKGTRNTRTTRSTKSTRSPKASRNAGTTRSARSSPASGSSGANYGSARAGARHGTDSPSVSAGAGSRGASPRRSASAKGGTAASWDPSPQRDHEPYLFESLMHARSLKNRRNASTRPRRHQPGPVFGRPPTAHRTTPFSRTAKRSRTKARSAVYRSRSAKPLSSDVLGYQTGRRRRRRTRSRKVRKRRPRSAGGSSVGYGAGAGVAAGGYDPSAGFFRTTVHPPEQQPDHDADSQPGQSSILVTDVTATTTGPEASNQHLTVSGAGAGVDAASDSEFSTATANAYRTSPTLGAADDTLSVMSSPPVVGALRLSGESRGGASYGEAGRVQPENDARGGGEAVRVRSRSDDHSLHDSSQHRHEHPAADAAVCEGEAVADANPPPPSLSDKDARWLGSSPLSAGPFRSPLDSGGESGGGTRSSGELASGSRVRRPRGKSKRKRKPNIWTHLAAVRADVAQAQGLREEELTGDPSEPGVLGWSHDVPMSRRKARELNTLFTAMHEGGSTEVVDQPPSQPSARSARSKARRRGKPRAGAASATPVDVRRRRLAARIRAVLAEELVGPLTGAHVVEDQRNARGGDGTAVDPQKMDGLVEALLSTVGASSGAKPTPSKARPGVRGSGNPYRKTSLYDNYHTPRIARGRGVRGSSTGPASSARRSTTSAGRRFTSPDPGHGTSTSSSKISGFRRPRRRPSTGRGSAGPRPNGQPRWVGAGSSSGAARRTGKRTGQRTPRRPSSARESPHLFNFVEQCTDMNASMPVRQSMSKGSPAGPLASATATVDSNSRSFDSVHGGGVHGVSCEPKTFAQAALSDALLQSPSSTQPADPVDRVMGFEVPDGSSFDSFQLVNVESEIGGQGDAAGAHTAADSPGSVSGSPGGASVATGHKRMSAVDTQLQAQHEERKSPEADSPGDSALADQDQSSPPSPQNQQQVRARAGFALTTPSVVVRPVPEAKAEDLAVDLTRFTQHPQYAQTEAQSPGRGGGGRGGANSDGFLRADANSDNNNNNTGVQLLQELRASPSLADQLIRALLTQADSLGSDFSAELQGMVDQPANSTARGRRTGNGGSRRSAPRSAHSRSGRRTRPISGRSRPPARPHSPPGGVSGGSGAISMAPRSGSGGMFRRPASRTQSGTAGGGSGGRPTSRAPPVDTSFRTLLGSESPLSPRRENIYVFSDVYGSDKAPGEEPASVQPDAVTSSTAGTRSATQRARRKASGKTGRRPARKMSLALAGDSWASGLRGERSDTAANRNARRNPSSATGGPRSGTGARPGDGTSEAGGRRTRTHRQPRGNTSGALKGAGRGNDPSSPGSGGSDGESSPPGRSLFRDTASSSSLHSPQFSSPSSSNPYPSAAAVLAQDASGKTARAASSGPVEDLLRTLEASYPPRLTEQTALPDSVVAVSSSPEGLPDHRAPSGMMTSSQQSPPQRTSPQRSSPPLASPPQPQPSSSQPQDSLSVQESAGRRPTGSSPASDRLSDPGAGSVFAGVNGGLVSGGESSGPQHSAAEPAGGSLSGRSHAPQSVVTAPSAAEAPPPVSQQHAPSSQSSVVGQGGGLRLALSSGALGRGRSKTTSPPTSATGAHSRPVYPPAVTTSGAHFSSPSANVLPRSGPDTRAGRTVTPTASGSGALSMLPAVESGRSRGSRFIKRLKPKRKAHSPADQHGRSSNPPSRSGSVRGTSGGTSHAPMKLGYDERLRYDPSSAGTRGLWGGSSSHGSATTTTSAEPPLSDDSMQTFFTSSGGSSGSVGAGATAGGGSMDGQQDELANIPTSLPLTISELE